MADQEHADFPQDERLMRRDMREKCEYEYQDADVNTFLAEKLVPALDAFENEIMDIAKTQGSDFHISIDRFGDSSYHENALDKNDVYSAYSYGMHTTTPQGLFYYSFYAMTRSLSPSGPYCVLIKRYGEYYTPDINAITKQQLLEDMKQSFTKVTT